MSAPIENDLNQVIASAVTARIEAQVAAALSGDEVIGKYVAAALNQQIDVRDNGSYHDRRTTYLREAIDTAMRAATKAAVERVIGEHHDQIEIAVREALTNSLDAMVAQLVKSMTDAAENPYGIKVSLHYPARD